MINNTALIETYTPALPAETWARMRAFVCGVVRDRFADARAPRDTERALHALTGFADWVLLVDIAPLDDDVLSADLIDAYANRRYTEVAAHTAERERKLLRTLSNLDNSVDNERPSTTAPPSQPYDRDEQDFIRSWTTWQPTAKRRSECSAIAALGLGCGLTGQEMADVTTRHLRILEDGMVAVQTAGRIVPVTTEWNDVLADLRTSSAESYLVAPDARRRSYSIVNSVLDRSGHARPVTQRMRATWLLNHVNGGTPLNTLIDAAGLTSPDVLRRLLPFAIRLEGDERVAALRLRNGGAR